MHPKRDRPQDEKLLTFHSGLRFEPQQMEQNRLSIKVFDENNVYKYLGQLDGNKNVNLQYVRKQLQKQTFQIEDINQNEFIVNIGAIGIHFKSVQKHEKNLLYEKIRKLEQRQFDNENKIKKQQSQIQQLWKTIKELKQQNKKEKETLLEQINSLKDQLKNFKQKQRSESIQKINQQLKNISPFPWGYSHLNQPIKSSTWSTQLKSNHIQINGNVAKLKNTTDQNEFCLLNTSFSHTIKSKQSWAIRINKNTGWIGLGICLKSQILNQNFNDKNINLDETGHGFYMIDSYGSCYSHSQNEFNKVDKSFEFDENDIIIFIEYDPIDKKLRFSKNKVEYFEMPIPTQLNDTYSPFAGFYIQNSQVELIPYQ